eukprot:444614_1
MSTADHSMDLEPDGCKIPKIDSKGLEHAKKLLYKEDSIMNVNALDTIQTLCKSGTDQQEVATIVSQSYRGNALAANLMYDLFQRVGQHESYVQNLAGSVLVDMILERLDVEVLNKFLQSVTKEPPWIDSLIEHQQWRSMFRKLRAKHSDCSLLDYINQKMVTQGYDEKEDDGSSQQHSSTFRSFFKAFSSQILRLLKSSTLDLTTEGLPSPGGKLALLCQLCCAQEGAYVFAQRALTVLARHPETGGVFRRIGQVLSRYAVSERPPLIIHNIGFALESIPHGQLRNSFISVFQTGEISNSHISLMHSEYTASDPPPITPLRATQCIRALIKSVFTVKSAHWRAPNARGEQSVDLDIGEKARFLLAYAVCVRDCRSYARDHEESSDYIEFSMVDKSNLDSTSQALKMVTSVCTEPHFGLSLPLNSKVLFDNLEIPVVASGIVHWLRGRLTSTEYFNTTYQSTCNDIFFCLLGRIISIHHHLRLDVFALLRDTFNVQLPSTYGPVSAVALHKVILKCMVHVLHHHIVDPVFDHFDQACSRMDHSLVRFFVSEILRTTSSPYSTHFLNRMFNVISVKSTCLALIHDPPSAKVLLEFCGEIWESKSVHPDLKRAHWVMISQLRDRRSTPR